MGKALIVEIFGDAKQFGAELDKAAGKTRRFGTAAGVVGGILAGGLALGLEKSVEAAVHGQAAQAALDQALKNTHQSVEAMKPALEGAEAASRKLGFTDDDTRGSLAKLETATGDTGKSITDLGIAEDLARFKHISLDAATKILTSTLAGNARAAKQLGIVVQPVTQNMDALKEKYKELGQAIPPAEAAQAKLLDKQATAAATLQAVTDKVHGQAEAYSKTAAGGMEQFHAQLQRIEEVIGTTLLPVLASMAAALASGASFLAEHATLAKGLVVALAAVAATLLTVSAATKVFAAAQAIARAAAVVWTAAQWLLNAALSANPIGLVVIALTALVAGLILAYKNSETFRTVVTAAFNAVRTAANAVLNFFRDNWKTVALLISGPFLPLVALATNAFGVRSALVGAFNAILKAARTAIGDIADAFRGAVGTLSGIAAAIGSAIVSAFTGAMRRVESAVTTGLGNIVGFFRALPGRIVGALGDLGSLLYSAGTQVVQGFVNGIKSQIGAAVSAAQSMASSAKNAVTGFLHIHSPSQVFMELGVQTVQGFINGMESRYGAAITSLGQFGARLIHDATDIQGKLTAIGVDMGGGPAMTPTQLRLPDGAPLSDVIAQQWAAASIAANPDASTGGYMGDPSLWTDPTASAQPEVIQLVLDGQVLAEHVRNSKSRFERVNGDGTW